MAKNSGSQFWPIVCSLFGVGIDDEVFVAGIYHGYKKPEFINDFLEEFVAEATLLETEGLIFNRIIIPFFIYGLVCDAPARGLVRALKATQHILVAKMSNRRYLCIK